MTNCTARRAPAGHRGSGGRPPYPTMSRGYVSRIADDLEIAESRWHRQPVSHPRLAPNAVRMTTSDSLLSPNPFREWPRSEIEQTLHGRFERIVAASCDREAVITRSERVTYRTLNALANRVARAIVARIGAEAEPVVLLFQQGLPAIIATLAALKAGKFYIPLEPGAAASNVSRLLEDSQARLMVTDARGLAAAREWCGTAVDVLDIDWLDSALPDPDLG